MYAIAIYYNVNSVVEMVNVASVCSVFGWGIKLLSQYLHELLIMKKLPPAYMIFRKSSNNKLEITLTWPNNELMKCSNGMKQMKTYIICSLCKPVC